MPALPPPRAGAAGRAATTTAGERHDDDQRRPHAPSRAVVAARTRVAALAWHAVALLVLSWEVAGEVQLRASYLAVLAALCGFLAGAGPLGIYGVLVLVTGRSRLGWRGHGCGGRDPDAQAALDPRRASHRPSRRSPSPSHSTASTKRSNAPVMTRTCSRASGTRPTLTPTTLAPASRSSPRTPAPWDNGSSQSPRPEVRRT